MFNKNDQIIIKKEKYTVSVSFVNEGIQYVVKEKEVKGLTSREKFIQIANNVIKIIVINSISLVHVFSLNNKFKLSVISVSTRWPVATY